MTNGGQIRPVGRVRPVGNVVPVTRSSGPSSPTTVYTGSGGIEYLPGKKAAMAVEGQSKLDVERQRIAQQLRESPEKVAQELAQFQTGLDFLNEYLKIKNQGFGGKPIDTGPIIGLVPNAVSQAYNQLFSDLKPYETGARSALSQMRLETLNPKRKVVTGSQAGEKELSTFVMPLVPGQTQNDPVFNRNVLQAAKNIINQRRNYIEQLKGLGFSVPDQENEEEIIKNFLDLIPPEQRPELQKPPFSKSGISSKPPFRNEKTVEIGNKKLKYEILPD